MSNSDLFFRLFSNTGAPILPTHRARGKAKFSYKRYMSEEAPRMIVDTKADVKRVSALAKDDGCKIVVIPVGRAGFIIKPE